MHSVRSQTGFPPKTVSHVFHYKQPFDLEGGETLPELKIHYTTYGRPATDHSNVVWICHALTANSDPVEWWPGLVGKDHLINADDYYIVCANILGSCYGTTGPADDNPEGRKYGNDFPDITIRDMVKAHKLLRQHLGINKILLGLGGSMGGQQILEWASEQPDLFEHICVVATNARHSAWGIAFNTAQRMAIEADPTFKEFTPGAGARGLEAARAIAMLSYRNQETYNSTQSDDEPQLNQYRAESYQRYQGQKLSKRFDAHAYYCLSKAMDSHDLGRGRGGLAKALAGIRARCLAIGIESDILFPLVEQQYIARHVPHGKFVSISSLYGHDGFLIESEQLSQLISEFLTKEE